MGVYFTFLVSPPYPHDMVSLLYSVVLATTVVVLVLRNTIFL